VTFSSDATSGMSTTSGSPGLAGRPGPPGHIGLVPAPADCFTPRPHTALGPLSALPEGHCLVFSELPRPHGDVTRSHGPTVTDKTWRPLKAL
jgi:hypothetical protein